MNLGSLNKPDLGDGLHRPKTAAPTVRSGYFVTVYEVRTTPRPKPKTKTVVTIKLTNPPAFLA
jgi:hypothetical protein